MHNSKGSKKVALTGVGGGDDRAALAGSAVATVARAPYWLANAFVTSAGATMARGLPPTKAPFVLLGCMRDTHTESLAAVRAALDGADGATKRVLLQAIAAAGG